MINKSEIMEIIFIFIFQKTKKNIGVSKHVE